MEIKLPDNWAYTSLEELSQFVIGGDWGEDPEKSLDKNNVDVLCIRGSELKLWSSNKGKTSARRKIKKSSLEKRELLLGDILVEISGGGPDQPVGRTVIIDKDVLEFEPEIPKVCTNFFRLVRLHKNIEQSFVNYYLQYFYQTGEIVNYQGGTNNLRNLRFPEYSKIEISLAPLPEQTRIVSKLDALFAHIDTLKTKLDRIPELLKNFRQQVLTQAVTGKLTEEWRKGKKLEEWKDQQIDEMREVEIKIPETWIWLPFSQIATIKSNLVEPNEFLNKYLIAPDNIESESGKLLSKPLVSEINPISPKHYFKKGLIIYSKIRPYLSKLIIADFEGLCSADMYPIEAKVDTKYLYFYMLSNEFLKYATTAGERSVLPKINQKGLSIIPVPVPSTLEQQEIVRLVEELFRVADTIEARYKRLKEKLDTLPQAILTKAFKGELVPQDPNDEPAGVLLERIRKEKAK